MGRKLLLTALCILVLLLSACAGTATPTPTPASKPSATLASTPTPAATPAKLRTLRMVLPGEVPNLDRFLNAMSLGDPVWFNVLEPLMGLDKAGKPLPGLATKVEPSPDLTKWRFYLRKGVKFHNGADFTARDVVETAKYLISVKDVSTFYKAMPIKEALAIDDFTVDLIFSNPNPLLPMSIGTLLIYPAAIARDNRESIKTNVIGTGPYRFVNWTRGQSMTIEKFDGYWGTKPQIDKLVVTFRPEAGVRLAALLAGEADWIQNLSPEEASKAPKVVSMPGFDNYIVSFDEAVKSSPLFADKKLREAVDYAIDRKALVTLFAGLVTPSQGQLAVPGDFGFNPNLKSRPYDLEKAKALVKEAGAVGKTVSFVASTDRYLKSREMAEAIAYMIEQTGLKVDLKLMPNAEASKYFVRTSGLSADMQLFGPDAPLEVEVRYSKLFVESAAQYKLSDRQTTRLFEEEQAETDLTKRAEKLGKTWAYLYEQAHYVPLFRLPWIWGIAKNLEWQINLTGTPYLPDIRFTD